ncbi:MAG: histidine kinase [Bacteroidota bacterium]
MVSKFPFWLLHASLLLLLNGPMNHLRAQVIAATHFDVEEGLPSNNVYRAMQDTKGFMWFPTDAGVVRYDGKTFEIFTREDGVTNNDVLGIYEDSQGRIWFLTLAGGLCYYYKGRIYHPKNHPALADGPKDSFVGMAFEDSRRRLWFATRSEGVYCLDGRKLIHYSMPYDVFKMGTGGFIEEEGRIYARLYGELWQIYPEEKCIREMDVGFTLQSANYSRWDLACALLCDFNGQLIRQSVRTDSVIVVSSRAPYKTYYTNLIGDTAIWLNNNSGGVEEFRMDPATAHWQSHRTLLENEMVNSVEVDREGNTWVTTRGNGVFMYRPQKIINVPGKDGEGIRSLFRRADGYYWMTTTDQHLARSRTTNLQDGYTVFNYFFGSEFNGFVELKDKRLLAYGPGAVLMKRFDFDSISLEQSFTPVHPLDDEPPIYESTEVNHIGGAGSIKKIYLSEENTIWIVSNRYFASFNYHSVDQYEIKRIFPGRFTSVTEDDGGTLWIGKDNGLFRYVDGELVSYQDKHTAFSTAPLDLAFSNRTGLWIATNGQGLINYDPRTGKIIAIGEEEGLAANLCQRIYLRGDEQLWVATKRGISCINLRGDMTNLPGTTINSMSREEGLIANEVFSLAFVGDTVVAATPKGLSIFHKKEIDYELPPPFTVLKNIRQGNQIYLPDESLSFSFQENSPIFYPAGISFGSGKEIDFRYRLDPIDDQWHETELPEIVYNQLPPNDYVFRLRSINKDGIISDSEARYTFKVRKAWWHTWWFRSGGIFLAFGLLWVGINWRYQQRNVRVEMQRKLVDAERKALRAQMNPHFIFNSLNSIQNFLARNDRKAAYTYLARFGKLMRNILENSDKTSVSVDEELTVLRLYLQMEALRADHRFQYAITLDDSIRPLNDRIPPMLLQPYVENAIWHGVMPLESGGRIDVHLQRENDGILCRIEDNGVGREAASRNRNQPGQVKVRSFGTRITEERLDLMNNRQKRNITVRITDLKNPEDQACGTRVELFVPLFSVE